MPFNPVLLDLLNKNKRDVAPPDDDGQAAPVAPSQPIEVADPRQELYSQLANKIPQYQFPEGLGLEGLRQAQKADLQRQQFMGLGQLGERAAAMMQGRSPNFEGLTPDQMNVRNYLAQRQAAMEDVERQQRMAMMPFSIKKTMAEVKKAEAEADKVPSEQRKLEADTAKTNYERLLLEVANNPNHPQAVAARSLLNKYVPGGVDEQMNLGTAERLFGSAANVEAGRMRLRAEAFKDAAGRLEPTSSPGLKPFNDNINAIMNVKGLMRNPDGSQRDMTKTEWEEAVSTFLGVLKNGNAATESERKAVMPPGGTWAQYAEFLTQKPHGLGKLEWQKRMEESLERLLEINQERLQSAQERTIGSAPVLTNSDKSALREGYVRKEEKKTQPRSQDPLAVHRSQLREGEVLILRNGELGAIDEKEVNPETDVRL